MDLKLFTCYQIYEAYTTALNMPGEHYQVRNIIPRFYRYHGNAFQEKSDQEVRKVRTHAYESIVCCYLSSGQHVHRVNLLTAEYSTGNSSVLVFVVRTARVPQFGGGVREQHDRLIGGSRSFIPGNERSRQFPWCAKRS